MRVLSAIGVLAWAVCAVAGEAKKAVPTTATGADTLKKGARLVVIQDKAPLKYEENVVGELAEGTRVVLLEQYKDYSKVRVTSGPNWFEGWIRTAMTVSDSIADVNVKVQSAVQKYVFENQTLPGSQFIEVKLKFEATEKSPPRLYLGFADEATADLYLSYGRDRKALPYGFWVRSSPTAKSRKFESKEKQQVLLLKAGESLQETYVFVIPLTAKERDLELVVKDKTLKLDLKGH